MTDGEDQNAAEIKANLGIEEVRTWIFDLDNTLYPVTERLVAHIDQHMGAFVANFLNVDATEARRIQKSYFARYGLTLRGLMIHHGLDPVRYFDEMTPMDLNEVHPNPTLSAAIRALEGRKIIYTNASSRHAEMVLARIGLAGAFEAIFDIADAGYVPKPAIDGYRLLCEQHAVDPARAAMIDDIARNLESASALGMTTVWMKTSAEWAVNDQAGPHIDHVVRDLLGWIEGVTAAQRAAAGGC
ncbi:MAG: pyrimidine 5'-nucleotidase [Alphaproteobacteria bacterium]